MDWPLVVACQPGPSSCTASFLTSGTTTPRPLSHLPSMFLQEMPIKYLLSIWNNLDSRSTAMNQTVRTPASHSLHLMRQNTRHQISQLTNQVRRQLPVITTALKGMRESHGPGARGEKPHEMMLWGRDSQGRACLRWFLRKSSQPCEDLRDENSSQRGSRCQGPVAERVLESSNQEGKEGSRAQMVTSQEADSLSLVAKSHGTWHSAESPGNFKWLPHG